MAAPELGSFSNGSAGNTTLSLNGAGTPVYIELWCGPRTGTTESSNIFSFGSVDIGNGIATWQSNLGDGTHHQTKNGAGTSTGSMCLTHYAIVAGAISKRIELKFVSAAAGQFTINVVTADANYTVYFKATY